MLNLTTLKFEALNITRNNYLSWILDIEIHLAAQSTRSCKIIKEGYKELESNHAKLLFFLRCHVHEGLKSESYDEKSTYIMEKFKEYLWSPKDTRWMHLRLQVFKSVDKYNYLYLKISFQLKLCGENINEVDLLEKN